jgi:toxin CcdB
VARFDVYRRERRNQLLLDCQADTLAHLDTRFVVPLIAAADAPLRISRLNPIFSVGGQRVLMATHLSASISRYDLGDRIGSLAHEHDRIMNALDVLLTGF